MSEEYSHRVARLSRSVTKKIQQLLRRHSLVHFLFIGLIAAEVSILIALFSLLIESALVALGLAVLFLTSFSYFVVRLYLQAKKPEQLLDLRDLFLESCKSLLSYQEGIPSHHLAHATCQFANTLEGAEHSTYRAPHWLRNGAEKLSCYLHWRDILSMRELLLSFAIEEQIKLVRNSPTDLQIHASLANSYVMFSRIYAKLKRKLASSYSNSMSGRFNEMAKRAVEELKILSHFAPGDPWVHQQLAYSYGDLEMADEEIREYETLVRLRPEEPEILFKLGTCYFQQGLNAKGIEVYEELKRIQYEKVDDLLHFYGSHT